MNKVFLSGNVGNVTYRETHVKGDPVITFMVCSEKEENYTTWVKVSAYGKQALYCKDKVKKGLYVILDGELSNKRARNSDYLELEVKITNRILVIDDGGFNIKPMEYKILKSAAENAGMDLEDFLMMLFDRWSHQMGNKQEI